MAETSAKVPVCDLFLKTAISKVNNKHSTSNYRIVSYSFSPSSWTCSSSCCALCHRLRRRRQVPRGDGHHEVAMVRRCGTSRGTWWDWSPQSWGCGPRPLDAQPCAALQGCCWGAGSTQSWLLWPYHSSDWHITSPSHLQWAEIQDSNTIKPCIRLPDNLKCGPVCT